MIVLLMIASSVGVILLIWFCMQGYLSEKWPETTGMVVESVLSKAHNNEKEKIIDIFYEYQVDGRMLRSQRLGMYLAVVFERKHAEELIKKYPKGKIVKVKYHPIFKKLAVLESGPKQCLQCAVFLCVFLAVLIVSALTLANPEVKSIFDIVDIITRSNTWHLHQA